MRNSPENKGRIKKNKAQWTQKRRKLSKATEAPVLGWIVSPRNYIRLEFVNVTVFGYRVFIYVTKLRWGHTGLEWELKSNTIGVPTGRGTSGHRHTEGRRPLRMETEIVIMLLEGKESQGIASNQQKLEEVRKDSSLVPLVEWPCWHLDFGLLALGTLKKNSVVSSLPVCGIWLQQPEETNSVRFWHGAWPRVGAQYIILQEWCVFCFTQEVRSHTLCYKSYPKLWGSSFSKDPQGSHLSSFWDS